MSMGFINVFSVLYLSFIVSLIFGLNDHDTPKSVIQSVIRRWFKLLGALVIIAVVVQILSHIS
jgi:hypothetical protein